MASCWGCHQLDSSSALTRVRPQAGCYVPGPPYFRFKSSFRDVLQAASQGCKSCLVLKDGIEAQCVGTPQPLTIWIAGEKGRSMDVADKYCQMPTLEFYTLPGKASPWPEIGVAGHVVEDAQSETCFDKIRGWIRDCDDNHDICAGEMSLMLPTRVINVGSENGTQDPFLYESAGEHERYITLSYCWGRQKSFSTTRDTILERKRGIAWSCLPKTFQDAVVIVRKLGVTYLWIDALCIVQDDERDWQRESGRMASIYGSSYLTICATRAGDVGDGCFGPRPSSNEHRYCDETGKAFSIFVRPMLKHDALRDWVFTGTDYPAFERAWCLQERILARRVVHYTKWEIVWDCRTKCLCECGGVAEDERESTGTLRKPSDEETRMSLMGAYNRGLGKIEHLQGVLASSDSSPEEIEEATFDLQDEAWELWANVLENYGTRKLTYQSDLLPALSGLARRLQEAGLGTYLAGLWWIDIYRQLTWSSTGGLDIHRPPSYIAPSFSPLSRYGAVHYARTGTDIWYHEATFKILEGACTPKGLDPTGEVTSGFIRLSGPLVAATLESVQAGGFSGVEVTCHTTHDKSNQFKFKWAPDTKEDADLSPGDVIYILRLFSHDKNGADGEVGLTSSGLVLQRCGTGEEEYRRIGFQHFVRRSVFQDAQMTEITII